MFWKHKLTMIGFMTVILMTLMSGINGAVMSVDLGNEWVKVAIVSPGKPMEVVLNTDSSRKTPLIVAFRNGERHFGEAALTTATRFPEKSFTYLLDVIGKKVDSPIVQKYKERFPYLNITSDPVKQTVILNHPEGQSYTPEELLAMILEKCRSFAQLAGDGATINEVVITIPPYMTQAEKRSIVAAANLAGLKVLQLINSNTAVALNYGVFRIKDFNETNPSYILFYDMGSTSTIATIASYQVMKTKEKGFLEKVPTLQILGVGYDRTLGGLEMQLRLRDHLAIKFSQQRNIALGKVTSNQRAMSKLLKESSRVKKILSANTETFAQVENVMNDLDLKVEVTRSDFETLCSDLLGSRLSKPVNDALAMSGLAISNIDQVILFGGNTRVPKVQEVLSSVIGGKDLGKSINSDEAAALGAVYQAAYLSKGFKVKEFKIKDINLFPIQVEFSRQIIPDSSDPSGAKTTTTKVMQRMLFNRGNVFPQKKVLTFNKHVDDFEFFVRYGDLKGFLSAEEIAIFDTLNISKAAVSGIQDVLNKNAADGVPKESKGIKAHFKLDESGILVLDSVEATFETKFEEDVNSGDTAKMVSDTIAKLGSTFSNFFTKNSDSEGSVEDGVPDQVPISSESNSTDSQNVTSSSNDTTKSSGNVTSSNDTSTNATGEVKKEIKIRTIKEPLNFKSVIVDIVQPGESELLESRTKLEELRKKDEERMKHDSLRNSLESFIGETKMKLYEKEFEDAVTEDEKESILKQLNEASDWLENESDNAKTEDLQSKLSSLKTVTDGLYGRVKEHRERPEAIKALKDMLNISSLFLDSAKSIPKDESIFTEVEISTLEVLVTGTSDWVNNSIAEQSKIPLSSSPVVTIKQIAEKIQVLDREVKYLVNKLKITPPKKKPTSTTPAPETVIADDEAGAKEEEKEEHSTTNKSQDEHSEL